MLRITKVYYKTNLKAFLVIVDLILVLLLIEVWSESLFLVNRDPQFRHVLTFTWCQNFTARIMFDRFTYLSGSDSLFVGCPSLHQTKAFKHSLLLQNRAQRASSLICGYYSFMSFKSLLETHASMSIFPQASSILFLKFYLGYRCFS